MNRPFEAKDRELAMAHIPAENPIERTTAMWPFSRKTSPTPPIPNPTPKKYELIEPNPPALTEASQPLYRVRALRDIGTRAKKGDIGGFVASERNLSQQGDAWIADSARVYNDAVVMDNALVRDSATVRDSAQVKDCATVQNNAVVQNSAIICGNATVAGHSFVQDYASVGDYALVRGSANVREWATVSDHAIVQNGATVEGCASVSHGSIIDGYAEISGNAEVQDNADFAVFKNSWSSNRWFTFTASNSLWRVGCFKGPPDSLIAQAHFDSRDKGLCYEAIVRAQEFIETVKKAAADNSPLPLSFFPVAPLNIFRASSYDEARSLWDKEAKSAPRPLDFPLFSEWLFAPADNPSLEATIAYLQAQVRLAPDFPFPIKPSMLLSWLSTLRSLQSPSDRPLDPIPVRNGHLVRSYKAAAYLWSKTSPVLDLKAWLFQEAPNPSTSTPSRTPRK